MKKRHQILYTEVTVKQMTQELRTLESVRYGFVSGKAE